MDAIMAGNQNSEVRTAFEAWFSDNGKWPRAIERSGSEYRLMTAQAAWQAFQAGCASTKKISPPRPVIAQPTPETRGNPFIRRAINKSIAQVSEPLPTESKPADAAPELDLFSECTFSKIALQKIASPYPNFRIYSAGWLGDSQPWEIMEVNGAVFREALRGPRKGQLSVMVPNTSRSTYITAQEMVEFDAAQIVHQKHMAQE